MTAYELSDQLIECITDGSTDLVCVEQAAQMIRQQADRIAELEKEIEECWCGGHSYAYLRAKNRLPQIKPLSDEEIKIIATQNRTDLTIPAYISFARAIEERHGIK